MSSGGSGGTRWRCPTSSSSVTHRLCMVWSCLEYCSHCSKQIPRRCRTLPQQALQMEPCCLGLVLPWCVGKAYRLITQGLSSNTALVTRRATLVMSATTSLDSLPSKKLGALNSVSYVLGIEYVMQCHNRKKTLRR